MENPLAFLCMAAHTRSSTSSALAQVEINRIMGQPHAFPLQVEVERCVQDRTHYRVRDLAVEVRAEHVVLRGRASSYYVKQLAQLGVREVLPEVSLENAIEVG